MNEGFGDGAQRDAKELATRYVVLSAQAPAAWTRRDVLDGLYHEESCTDFTGLLQDGNGGLKKRIQLSTAGRRRLTPCPQCNPLNYGKYLQLDTKILNGQRVLGSSGLDSSAYAAEHFFIVTHQAFELWFKQIVIDLKHATRAIAANPDLALNHLQRVEATMQLLIQQMMLFHHLRPRDFLDFREFLGSASGAQSKQFRAIQRALGLDRKKTESDVYRAFLTALQKKNIELRELYHDPLIDGVLYQAAETLVDISESFWVLVSMHLQTAERQIGAKQGSAGSQGILYLKKALDHKAFPELWNVRSDL
jgi:tryptophan 2,3-dioxygenase